MPGFDFTFNGLALTALPSRALLCRDHATLIASDLHLGRSLRGAFTGGATLPPFDAIDTLARLEAEIAAHAPRRLILLGDSFDRSAIAPELPPAVAAALTRITRQVECVFVSGNHDPAEGVGALDLNGVALRHIAGEGPDISGHYHPKLRFAGQSFAVFLISDRHVILPAFGTFTGGLEWRDPALRGLIPKGLAIAAAPRPFAVPLPLRLRRG
ncbi:MAG: metallophosphoesterase [Tepidimonas taiwanensis]|nr:metallophosphoesterase [Tepidimonas taiwanensis]